MADDSRLITRNYEKITNFPLRQFIAYSVAKPNGTETSG